MAAAPDRVVVVGSSAGGIDALSTLIGSLPVDLLVPIVIAQHLDPRRASRLVEILGRQGGPPVRVVEDRTPLEAGVAFVAPPNRNVGIEGREITLSPAEPGTIAPSVDRLLSSAAIAFGPGVIAVILSGSGSDGAAGAADVKRAGGAVLIENPASAQFGSMPAAVPAQLVDGVVDIAKMGEALTSLMTNGSQAMPSVGLAGTAARQQHANGRPRRADAGFFRDRSLFEHLATAVWPELIARATREGTEIRVWLVGCSTGEDAYSLGIAALEAIERSGQPVSARIFATDANAEAIATARRGRYPAASLGRMSSARRARYLRAAEGGYEIARPLRAMMVFGQHDLLQQAPFPQTDLVLCQDILKTLPVPLRRIALETFAFSLRPRSRLVLGPSDTAVALAEAFVEESRRPPIYRRTGRPTRLPLISRASLAAVRGQMRAGNAGVHAGQRTNGAGSLATSEGQAAQDVLQALNEQLQATNEELETVNEELSASIDELRSTNEELAARTAELAAQAVELHEEKRHSDEDRGRLRAILASIGDAVVAVDPRGATLATNPAYERFVESAGRRFAPLDLLGRAVPEDQWPQRRAARGESFDMEFAIRTRRGTYQWYEAVAEPLTFTDRSWGGVVTIRDISERTMRISLERLMAAASHELRTPLAALHGYVQLLERHLRQHGPEAMSRYSAQALGQTRQIGALVDLLFDVSRVRSGQFTIDTERVDLAEVVRHAADTVRAIAGAPPIALSLPRSRVTVIGDPARLEQVIVNLIGNAVEHADTPRVAVSVRRSGEGVRIRIRDFGTGIDPAALADLFEPFRPLQLREVSSPGMGLGLFLSREIVLAHGGSIDVASAPGEGTVVTITLDALIESAKPAHHG